MRREKEVIPEFAIKNPNKVWVSEEIDKLILEWQDWASFCEQLVHEQDSADFNPNTCTEAIKDGFKNRREHEILREKTLVFLRNHFSGAEFILKGWSRHPYEDVTSRLNQLAPYWLHRLQILKASMDYVQVPESFWQGQGKAFLESLSKTSADGAIEVAKTYLKNPMAN